MRKERTKLIDRKNFGNVVLLRAQELRKQRKPITSSALLEGIEFSTPPANPHASVCATLESVQRGLIRHTVSKSTPKSEVEDKVSKVVELAKANKTWLSAENSDTRSSARAAAREERLAIIADCYDVSALLAQVNAAEEMAQAETPAPATAPATASAQATTRKPKSK